jgi:hypothetical protein
MQSYSIARFSIFLLFLMKSGSCVAADKQQQDLEALLQKSFDQLFLAIGGLEYPHTVKQLNNCFKYNDKDCLRVHNHVLEGKKRIKSVASMKTLDTTLNLIEKYCLSKNEYMANVTCFGAILSLYFYTTPEQDAKILNRMKIYPKKLKFIIFNYDFYWFYNRPNTDAWVSAVSTMDIDWEYKLDKQRILALFGKNLGEMQGETFIAK